MSARTCSETWVKSALHSETGSEPSAAVALRHWLSRYGLQRMATLEERGFGCGCHHQGSRHHQGALQVLGLSVTVLWYYTALGGLAELQMGI